MKTLSQILIDVNSYVDLTAALPTGDDLTTRINYAQQAVEEWGSAYKWRQLRQSTQYFATGATHTLESNFRELLSPPHETNVNLYPEIGIQETGGVENVSDRYCTINTDYIAGSTLVINGLSTAGATISYEWQRFPSNMATLTSICEVPDPDFVKLKTISYILQSRLDERFPSVEAKAGMSLQNMIGREMISRPGGFSTIPRFGTANYALGRR